MDRRGDRDGGYSLKYRGTVQWTKESPSLSGDSNIISQQSPTKAEAGFDSFRCYLRSAEDPRIACHQSKYRRGDGMGGRLLSSQSYYENDWLPLNDTRKSNSRVTTKGHDFEWTDSYVRATSS